MNFFALILALYFLGLNLVPCEDSGEFSGTDSHVQEISPDLEFSSSDADDCSPFCQCHCCHVHITNFNVIPFVVIEPLISTLIIQKGEISGQEISKFHFQPPRD